MNKKTLKLAQYTAKNLNNNNVSAFALTCWKELQRSEGISKLNEFISRVKQDRALNNDEVLVQIASARRLSGDELTRIAKSIKNKYGIKITTECFINPKIIGGVVIKIQDQIIDLSWQGRLKQLKTKLVGTYE